MFPKILTDLDRWICWNLVDGQKVPRQVNGLEARTNDPSTFSHFELASQASQHFQGLAFILCEEDGLTGVDLDSCITEEGELKPWAAEVLNQFRGIAYAEISPSGRGIKLVTKAKKPFGSGCKHAFGGPKEQIECYDKFRFWAMTGDLWSDDFREIGDGQSAVDWLTEKYLKVNSEPAKHYQTLPVNDLERRAAAYMEKAESAPVGDRNGKAFRLAGHLRSLHDDYGNRLSPDKIAEFILAWNSQNSEPLSDAEIRKCVESACVNGTPRQDKGPKEKLCTSRFVPNETAEIDIDLPVDKPEDARIPRDLIDGAPGLIGEVINYMTETARYPQPEVFLASALSLMSVITGRKITDESNMRTNLYCLSIAPTSTGKDHGRSIVKRIMVESGVFPEYYAPEDLASAPAIANWLKEHPSTLFQLDEFGRLLESVNQKHAPSHLRDISTTLMRLYTSSNQMWLGKAYADVTKTPQIDQPHAVINATTTAEAFWNAISRREIQDGLIGRLSLFEGSMVRMRRSKLAPIPESITAQVRWWHDFLPKSSGNLNSQHPQPEVLDMSEDTFERLLTHQEDCSHRRENEDPLRAAIWSRVGERSTKFALLAAAARKSLRIEREDVEWGIALSNSLARKLCVRADLGVSDNEQERVKKRVLQVIAASSGGLSQRNLTRKTQFLRDSRERSAILADLEEGGFIQTWLQETEKGPGRVMYSTFCETGKS